MATNKKAFAFHVREVLLSLYPDTHTFLNFNTDWQLLFATILSAQATDKSVNEATEILFQKFPKLEDYTEENKNEILFCIKKVGLGKSKCEYLIKSAKILIEKYGGELPKKREELMTLPGCGFKTSGVVLAELYDYPYIPVDTHVYRVSHRLGLVSDRYDANATELQLEKLYQNNGLCIQLHRAFILLGRNICLAQRPKCDICPFVKDCPYHKKQK